MNDRTFARAVAKRHLDAGDPLGWFESLYAEAGGDTSLIPWAELKPNPNLLAWLDARRPAAGRALVVGCELGDDAEELARRGFVVTAFDVAPTAIQWCKRRFPQSPVEYVVADVLATPAHWAGAFDLVVESYTLQAIPQGLRPGAVASMSESLAGEGELLVICRGREPEDPLGEVPWPLTKPELATLAGAAGLVAHTFEDYPDPEEPTIRRFRVVFRRR